MRNEVCLEKHPVVLFVEKNSAGRLQLLEKIEIRSVTCQHRASVFSCGCEEQGVIQGAAPMVFPISLQTGENARQDAGFPPYLGVRDNCSVTLAPFDHSCNLRDDLARSQVSRIK